ncbi:MAG: hypothetical protein V1737_03005 [Chloroflexota bacterium]
MTRKDYLLLLVAGDGSAPEIDPVRIMKGMFLFTKQFGHNLAQSYTFQPYNFGPCSFEIYDDLRALVQEGLLQENEVQGKTWNFFRVTAKGRARADEISAELGLEEAGRILDIRRLVSSMSFINLLRYVYQLYPEYAAASVVKT